MDSDYLGDVIHRVEALRQRHRERDMRHREIQAIRRGNFEAIWPDAFSDVFQRPIVANLIDTAARDAAAMLAPLPSFNCSAATMLTDVAKKFADKRSKIANNYINSSDLQWQMNNRGADQLISYGLLVLAIEPDFASQTPWMHVEDAVQAYPVIDMKGNTKEFARAWRADWFQLEADYPEMGRLRSRDNTFFRKPDVTIKVDVVKYTDQNRICLYLPQYKNFILEDLANPLGDCPYICVQRPGIDDEQRGAYDDVIWVQLARHRLQALLIEGTEKAVRAPMVVPPDVDDLALGPDGVIHTNAGAAAVGRARLDMPSQAFGAVEALKQEQMLGAMSPESRSGQMEASVITGRGAQQLMAAFSSQQVSLQTTLAFAYKRAIEKCFDMDERLWPDVEKEVRGQDAGVPYSIRYRPSRDIKGDHTVDVSYGFAAGLDPNRSLVFLLQVHGAGGISTDYLRRNLPVGINAAEEESKITVEQSRSAIVQGFIALAQAIPQLAAAGQDPTQIIDQTAAFIEKLQEGLSPEKAARAALAPPPQVQAPSSPSLAGGEPPGVVGGPEAPPGLPAPEEGRPDLQMLMAGLGAGGSPQLSASVSRMLPTG